MALLRQDVSWNRESNGSSNNIALSTDPLAYILQPLIKCQHVIIHYGMFGQPGTQLLADQTCHTHIEMKLPLNLRYIYNEGLWSVNQVTPLYNLHYHQAKLKFYASKVRHGLVSAVQSSSTKFKVTFEEQLYLRYCKEDASALVITVTSSAEDNSKSKVAYTAILLSWGVSTTIPGSIHLPFMLERGEHKVGSSVKANLQTIFDCNITQYNFTQHQLLQFGFNFLDNYSSKSTDPFIMIYKTPQVEHKDKITLTFEIGDISLVWNKMKGEHSSEREKLTYQMLANQLFHKSEIDITFLELLEVKTAKAEVKSSGAIKVKTPELTNCMFLVLNDINKVREFDIRSTDNTTVDE